MSRSISEHCSAVRRDLRGQFTLSPLPAALAASAQPDSQCLQLLEDTGEIGSALHWLRHAIKQNPDDREFAEALAETLALAGKTAEAIHRYESIVQGDQVGSKLARPGDRPPAQANSKQARLVSNRCCRSIQQSHVPPPISSQFSSRQENFGTLRP